MLKKEQLRKEFELDAFSTTLNAQQGIIRIFVHKDIKMPSRPGHEWQRVAQVPTAHVTLIATFGNERWTVCPGQL